MFISYKAVVSANWSSIKISVQIMELVFKGNVSKVVSHSLETEEMRFSLSFLSFPHRDEVLMILLHSKGFLGGSICKESACSVGEPDLISGSGRSSGEGRVCLQCGGARFDLWVRKILWRRKWHPLRYSCLENSMDRGAW